VTIDPQVVIRWAGESDAESICDAVKAIAAEKWYLATVDGFSPELTRAFIKHLADAGLPQVAAFAEGRAVGFCDISRSRAEGFTHLARLGMGVRAEWRRQGVGRRLLDACVAQAKKTGIERIELEVFSDNNAAVQLYESFGFVREGVRVRARKFEGRYQDLVLMALWT
jgi:RimJ/RimL family protein N-acetyltransferase